MVNQKPYEMGPDEILTVTVPVGTVSAQLPGQALTNWTLSAPTYSQKIEIVPESDATPTQVARPISTEPEVDAMVPCPLGSCRRLRRRRTWCRPVRGILGVLGIFGTP